MDRLAIVTAVNDEEILRNNLARSPMIASGSVEIIVEYGHKSAAAALNRGIQRTSAELMILVHQDVYLPGGWDAKLLCAAKGLRSAGESWGALGVWGIKQNGGFAGRVWCTGSGREFAAPMVGVCEAVSIDEIVIVLNRSGGLQFDEQLPGFHLYATDIVRQAHHRGLKAYVFDAPVVHNSRCNPNVYDRLYRSAYRYMQRKWREELPLPTCVAPITRYGHWDIRKRWLKAEIRRVLGHANAGPRHQDPQKIAEQFGYEKASIGAIANTHRI